jgi:hypothetical protein
VERPGIHLGVGAMATSSYVWGTTREVPAFCLDDEVVAHGADRREASPRAVTGNSVNVGRARRAIRIKIVDEGVGRLIPDCPALGSSLTGANRSSLRVRRPRES